MGGSTRKAIEEGRGDFTPVFFSEIPELFRTNLHPNVVLLHLSTPDEHGYCSFGVSCDYTKPAAECADLLIAQINPKMPRTMGDSFIHVSKLDYIVEQETDLIELPPPHIGEVERAIGENIACSWASAPFPMRCCCSSRIRRTSASIPRCSATAW